MHELGPRPGVDQRSQQSRRDFLKNAARFSTGIVIASALPEIEKPAFGELSRITADVTRKQTGNSGFRDNILEQCKNSPDIQQCSTDYLRSPDTQLLTVVFAPINEEFQYRAVPSLLVSATDKNTKNPFKDLAVGTGGFKFSRRELVAGAITTLTFGFLHNVTNKGFDTNTIPVSQLALGAVNWVLQRRFGALAPIINHARWNYKFNNE